MSRTYVWLSCSIGALGCVALGMGNPVIALVQVASIGVAFFIHWASNE